MQVKPSVRFAHPYFEVSIFTAFIFLASSVCGGEDRTWNGSGIVPLNDIVKRQVSSIYLFTVVLCTHFDNCICFFFVPEDGSSNVAQNDFCIGTALWNIAQVQQSLGRRDVRGTNCKIQLSGEHGAFEGVCRLYQHKGALEWSRTEQLFPQQRCTSKPAIFFI